INDFNIHWRCIMHDTFEWVDIEKVLPNPKNPRKDPAVESETMQKIINSKGWEVVLSAYKMGEYYILISGHRRLYAAKKLDKKQIPIFAVDPPENDADEHDRLGSIQGGQKDWNPYEIAKYTYDMWKVYKKISYEKLAVKLNTSKKNVAAGIRVYQYYSQ